MPDFKAIFEKAKNLFLKLDKKKKIILGATVGVTLVALIMVTGVSTSKGKVALFSSMQAKDFAAITTKLEEKNFPFSTSGTSAIFVSPDKKNAILMALAQENLIPNGVHGWELFDDDKWSETQFEKSIKLQRAMMGNLSNTLSTLRNVDKATVNIAFPPKELFTDRVKPITAAVLIKYAPGVNSLKEKEIRGIVTLVTRSVPGLSDKNVSVADSTGKIINTYDDEVTKEKWKLEKVKRKLKIEEKERVKLLVDLQQALQSAYTTERVDIVRLEVKLNWDEEEQDRKEVEPVVMVKDNPKTPYSERVVKDSLTVSSKKTTEHFKGNGFTPEGTTGTEPNIPPGYKDKDYQKADYKKTEDIVNREFNRIHRKVKKQEWELKKVQLAVFLDGLWIRLGEKTDGTGYERKYNAVSKDEIRKVTNVLKTAMGYSIARGDQISVEHLQKDHSKKFAEEDAELRHQKAMRKLLLAVLIGALAIVIGVVIYQSVKKEIERRRRLREEELAAQQQMMRDAALRAIEEEGVEVEMSLEERARREMLENAISLAKERPEDVANLIRTWLADE